jgi:hypothetical protein
MSPRPSKNETRPDDIMRPGAGMLQRIADYFKASFRLRGHIANTHSLAIRANRCCATNRYEGTDTDCSGENRQSAPSDFHLERAVSSCSALLWLQADVSCRPSKLIGVTLSGSKSKYLVQG